MSMSDRSEGAMTALVDTVCKEAVGDDWSRLDPWKKYQVKTAAMPVITACVAAVDAEPRIPKRGDEVEAWIKRARDGENQTGAYGPWDRLDDLLDDYRLHADTGTPLNEPGF